jgi:hypothetical protein
VDAPRSLLLACDPVAAWHDHAASPAWRAVASAARVFVSSDRGADAFGWRGPRTTLERWARTPPVVVADPLRRRRALVAAIVAESPRGAAVDPLRIAEDAAGHAGVAGPAVRELLRVADLDAPPPGLAPGLARWWQVARRYRDALAADGLADPAEVLRLASRRVRRGEVGPLPIAVLGHLDLQPDEVDLIDALAAPGSVVVLPHDPPWTDANEPARAGLRARGWSETIAEGAGASGPAAHVVARAPATREAEARWAIAEAKRLLLTDVPPEDVTIASRDLAAYAGPVRTAARAAGLPLRVERWVPLASTLLAAPVMAWLEAVAQRGAFEATLAWLAHPRVAQLTADDIDLLRRWRPDDVRAWRRAGPSIGDALAWPERAYPRAWAELLATGWGGFGLAARVDPATMDALPGDEPDGPDGQATDGPFDDPLLGAVWRDALASLAEVADEDGRVRRGAVLATLRDALRAETTRDGAPPGRMAEGDADADADVHADAAVTLRPLEALADARVRHVLLLGAVDGTLPQPTPDDPVLGFQERAALASAGVPLRGAGDLARGEALRFWGAWRAAGDRLWLGVPAQTGRDARLPSPFLARLGVVAEAAGEPPPASPQAFRMAALRAVDTVPDTVDPVLAHARRAHAQALAREAEPRWGPDDGFVGIGVDPDARRWSATQLTDLGTCRFKWWVGRVWGVSAPEEGATELTPLLLGSLYHAALDGALKAAVGRSGGEARRLAVDALDAAFTLAERSEGIADVVPHWARRREDHLAHLRALLGAEAFLPDDHQVLALERWFRGVWEGWQVVGRVDRVDRTPAGVRLIDYKLGSGKPLGARDAEMAPTLDLQLPLYVEVAAPQVAPGEPVAGAAYLSLRKMTEIRAQPPEPHELDDLFRRLRDALRAGFFPVEPHPDVCRRCDLDMVCRKGPHLDLKPSAHRVPSEGAAAVSPAAAGEQGAR